MKRILLATALAATAFCAQAQTQTSYSPDLDVCFRTAAGNTGWNNGFPKNAADEGNTNFEGNYFAGLFVLQKYTVANIQDATSLTLTLTDTGTTGVDGTMVWCYPNSDWTADASVDDVVSAVTEVVGVAPRSSEGTVNTPLATGKKVPDSNPKQGYFTLTGSALEVVKASATSDGTFTLMITDKNLISNSSRKFYSSNTANAEAVRPVLTITAEEPAVKNTTTGVGYESLEDAIDAAIATGEDAVIEVSADQVLTKRQTWNIGKSLTVIPTQDITIRGPKNAMWFLANKNDGTMSIGSKDHKIIFDGNGDDRSSFNNAHVTRRENTTKLYLTNIEFKDFVCGDNSLIGCKNAGGGIFLEDIAMTNCSTTGNALIDNLREQNDAVLLKGFLNVTDCTGATVYTKNRIRLGDPEGSSIYQDFSASDIITINWGGEYAEGTNVVVKVPGTAADKFQLTADDWYLNRKASNGDLFMTQTNPSGIDEMNAATVSDGSSSGIYTLSGQRVTDTYKGIIIRNGKKVFNR